MMSKGSQAAEYSASHRLGGSQESHAVRRSTLPIRSVASAMVPSLSADGTAKLTWPNCRTLDPSQRSRIPGRKNERHAVVRKTGFMMDRASNRSEARTKPASGTAPHIVSPDDRAAAGKALRDKLAREQHGRWKASKGRPNPLDILHKLDAGRAQELVPIRYGRMLQSPFAFYRGSAGVMAADLARTPSTGLKVQLCGDCHLMNFGGFATPERKIIFDINDFDQRLRD